jgi:ribonuclease D
MNYLVIKTADDLRKAVETLTSQPVIGLDTETTELDPYTSRLRLVQLATPFTTGSRRFPTRG